VESKKYRGKTGDGSRSTQSSSSRGRVREKGGMVKDVKGERKNPELLA